MMVSGENPSIILPSSPKFSVDESMNIEIAPFGETILDAAPSSNTLSAEGRSPDDPGSSASNLKLSVGCMDSDEDLADDLNLNDRLISWRMCSGPSACGQFENDFDIEIPPEKIKAMISGEEYIFAGEGEREFADEVFVEKEPKIYHGYLFGDIVGEGSYSKVKEVVEEDSLVRRAIKIIKHSKVRKIPNGPENVQREMKILRKLKHKNVISLIETFKNEEKGKLYLVFEFCMGSLQQHIDSAPGGKLLEYESHVYFVQLISGLEYIHSIGIIHKDIKPGNLLLGSNLNLKISDFGVAEELPLFQPDDTCTIVQGTPKFQAPELVSGTTTTFHGFKSDVWSAGVTLYNMISGEYPFDGEAIMKLFDNIAKQPLRMPSSIVVKSWLDALLTGMLMKNPSYRFSVEQIKRSLWYNKVFEKKYIDEYEAAKQKLHRPLTVGHSLDMLYQNEPRYGHLEDAPPIPNTLQSRKRFVNIRGRVFGCFKPTSSP